jgi:hypothetical protein
LHLIKTKEVFQTLENRGSNNKQLEQHGPYPCHWDNSWLGEGYYLWDTFIGNAHWWGKEARRFKNGYIICKAECDFNTKDCLDLHGDLEQIKLVKDAFDLMLKNGVVNKNTTVKNFLAKLRGQTNQFKSYTAIRVNGIKSKSFNSLYTSNIFFETDRPQFFEMMPAVQICFFKKNSLNLRNYKVVYPEYFIDGYYV